MHIKLNALVLALKPLTTHLFSWILNLPLVLSNLTITGISSLATLSIFLLWHFFCYVYYEYCSNYCLYISPEDIFLLSELCLITEPRQAHSLDHTIFYNLTASYHAGIALTFLPAWSVD